MPKRSPDYEEKSRLLAEKAEQSMEDLKNRLQEKLAQHALSSVSKLVDLTDEGDPAVRLNAVKHHLKLLGMEIERKELTGKDGVELFKPLQIIAEAEEG